MSQPVLIAACPSSPIHSGVIYETDGHDQRCNIHTVLLLEQKGTCPHNLHGRAYQSLVAMHCFHVMAHLSGPSVGALHYSSSTCVWSSIV